MKYALILESDSQVCTDIANLVACMGYLVTPVFNPRKALHAAHMIQFDLIVTGTAAIPGDRRSLTGELARCSPDAALIFMAEPGARTVNMRFEGVNAVVEKPVVEEDLRSAIDHMAYRPTTPPRQQRFTSERRRRAVD